ncbi:MAG: RNA 2',3'-cyclic phosphodiesterase [Rhodospirillaceae bacterium]
MRLFVALALPDGIIARLHMMCSGIPGARWVEPENMHITLRFIGEVDEPTAEEINFNLSQIEAPAFDLELQGLNTFGQGYKAHTLWVGVPATADLTHLQKKVDSAVIRAGVPPEERTFTPHVTLARMNKPEPGRLQSFIEGNNLFKAGPFTVEDFTLFESRTGKGGPVYTALEDYALG